MFLIVACIASSEEVKEENMRSIFKFWTVSLLSFMMVKNTVCIFCSFDSYGFCFQKCEEIEKQIIIRIQLQKTT